MLGRIFGYFKIVGEGINRIWGYLSGLEVGFVLVIYIGNDRR